MMLVSPHGLWNQPMPRLMCRLPCQSLQLQHRSHVTWRTSLPYSPHLRLLRWLAPLIHHLLRSRFLFILISGVRSVSSRPSIPQPSAIICPSSMGCLRETSQCQVRRNSDLNNTLWRACRPVDIAGAPSLVFHSSETTSLHRCVQSYMELRPRVGTTGNSPHYR